MILRLITLFFVALSAAASFLNADWQSLRFPLAVAIVLLVANFFLWFVAKTFPPPTPPATDRPAKASGEGSHDSDLAPPVIGTASQ